MKIQENYSLPMSGKIEYYKASKGDEQRNLKVEVEGNPVSVFISETGYEYYRKKIAENESGKPENFEDFLQQRQNMPQNVTTDIQGLHYNNMFIETNKLNKSEVTFTLEKGANNFLKTYAHMYDEIVKGYADGTREVWVSDSSNEEVGSYRKLTMEEDLNALDNAYETHVQNFVDGAKQKEKFNDIMSEHRKQVERIKGINTEGTELSTEHIAENAQQKMSVAVQNFKYYYKEAGDKMEFWNKKFPSIFIDFDIK